MKRDVPHLPPPEYDEETRRRRLDYLQIGPREAVLLRELEAVVAGHLDDIADRFYDYLTTFPQTRRVFGDDGAMIARLKQAQKEYLLQALRGPFDRAYFERRWRIGYIHNVIDLEPEWFVGAFQLYHRLLYPLIRERYRDDPSAALEHILALDKVMTLDMELGLESYWAHYDGMVGKLHQLNVRLQAVSAAKSQFLANMSHEFRTPLNAILGFTEVLQDGVAGPLNEDQREYLGDIYQAGKILLRLIDDVLDLAKVEAGRLELFHEPFPLAAVIRDAITVLRGAAERKGLRLSAELPPDLGTIEADQLRVKQILFNLLSNAVKFTNAGSVVVSARGDAQEVHIVVLDTGIGIARDEQARIFEEFHQVEAPDSHHHEGAGLGLTLTRRLAEAHGGRVWVESEPGKGSAFHVVLPRRHPAAGGGQA